MKLTHLTDNTPGKFTSLTSAQEAAKASCIRNAETHCGQYYQVVIEHEQIYTWNGMFSFMLSLNAKPEYSNTALVFTQKTWVVTIGRNGGVKSQLIIAGAGGKKQTSTKRNKYHIFI